MVTSWNQRHHCPGHHAMWARPTSQPPSPQAPKPPGRFGPGVLGGWEPLGLIRLSKDTSKLLLGPPPSRATGSQLISTSRTRSSVPTPQFGETRPRRGSSLQLCFQPPDINSPRARGTEEAQSPSHPPHCDSPQGPLSEWEWLPSYTSPGMRHPQEGQEGRGARRDTPDGAPITRWPRAGPGALSPTSSP